MSPGALDLAVVDAVIQATASLEERGVPVPIDRAARMDFMDGLHEALAALVDRLPVAAGA